MNIALFDLIAIIICHTIGDFFIQTRKQAENKSKSLSALNSHIFTYTLCLAILMSGYAIFINKELNYLDMIAFAILSGTLHFFVDLITSKFTSHFYKTNNKWFFRTLGIDQALHLIMLFYVFALF